jgi:hypothetical protein
MVPENSLQCSQESSTGPHPGSGESNPYHPIYFCKNHLYFPIYIQVFLVNSFLLYFPPPLALSRLGPWHQIFSFIIILQTVGLLGLVISSSQGLYLNTGQHEHRINTYTYQRSIPCVGFKPTIPAFERMKTVHALDRAATVTDSV